MICKNKKMRKQIMSLLLATVMTTTTFGQLPLTANAANNTANSNVAATGKQKSTSRNNLGAANFATGDLGEYGDEINNEDTISVEEFEEVLDETSMAEPLSDADELPSSVDNSTSKYFPAIGNQDHIGSCVSWSEVYYGLTYATCRAKDISATGDNVMAPAFVYDQIKCANGGAYVDDAHNILLTEGAPKFSTADFESYTLDSLCKTWFPEKNIWLEAKENRLTSVVEIEEPGEITSVDDSDLDDLKRMLNDGYLINCSTDSVGWISAKASAKGTHAGENIIIGDLLTYNGHRMVIVGYDDNVCCDMNGDGVIDNKEKGAFKVANSWGDDWGNNGFVWFSYDSLNMESEYNNFYGYRIPALYYFTAQYVEPTAVISSGADLVLTLNTDSRSEARVTVRAINDDGDLYEKDLDAFYGENSLSYSLDGSEEATDGTITYDLNNIVENISKNNVSDYTWSVIVKDTNANEHALIVKDAYIEANGTKIKEYSGNDIQVDGNENTINITGSLNVLLNWDIDGNESTVNMKRTFTAGVKNADNNVDGAQYKFILEKDGQVIDTKDYSANVTYTTKPSETGTYSLSVFAKVNNEVLFNRFSYNVNEMPSVDTISYKKADFYVNEKAEATVSFKNGAGTKKIQALYVTGGNYPYTSETRYFTITGDNTATWTPDMDGEYTVYVTTKDNVGAINLENVGTITVNPARAMTIDGFESSAKSGASILDNTTLSADVAGGSGAYEYRFGIIHNGTEYDISNGYTSNSSISKNFSNFLWSEGNVGNPGIVGVNTLFVDARDVINGTTARKTIDNFEIKGLEISKFVVDSEVGYGLFVVGKKINLTAEVKNEATYRYNTKVFSYIYNGVETVINNYGPSSGESCSFVPEKSGEYTFKYYIKDNIGQEATKTFTCEVKGNTAVVYYNNPSWSTANIHYRVEGGSWTAVPGVQMNVSYKDGYKFMYLIDLGDKDQATVCFNNGNNAWDSNNGNNYTVKNGINNIKDNNVEYETLSASFEVKDATRGSRTAMVHLNGGYSAYILQFEAYKDGELYLKDRLISTSSDVSLFGFYKSGLYNFKVTVYDYMGNCIKLEDEYYFAGIQINLEADKQGDYQVGDEVNIKCEVKDMYYYRFPPATLFSVMKDGFEVGYTRTADGIKFVADEAGEYIICYYIPEYELGPVQKVIKINVTETVKNEAKIYYNNSSWESANIHYCVENGNWTNVPGVKMMPSDNPRYTWMYVIDLKDAQSVQVCFNNGNGTWDSNNGANYRLGAGSYSIVYGMIFNA